MIAAWMLSAIAIALLVALAAAVSEPLPRALGRPTRWLWLGAMTTALLLPVWQTRSPLAPIASSGSAAAGVRSGLTDHGRRRTDQGPRTTDAGRHRLAIPVTLPEQARESIARIDVAPLVPWDRWLVRLWIGMSALVLAYLVLAFAGARRLRRRLMRAEVDGQSVLLSPECGPAALGVLHVDTVIPQWALALGCDDRRLILAHEAEHARGRDPLVVFAALLLLALEPWNVGLWLIVARLRFAVEADCDARVLARASSPAEASNYGRLLVRVHAQAPASASLRLTFVGTQSKLERRVRLIMQRRRGLRPIWASATALLATTLLICAWAVPSPKRPTPAPPAPQPLAVRAGASPCTGSHRADVASFGRLRELARTRYRDRLRAWSSSTIAVVGFLLDSGSCSVVRDTIDWIPRASSYSGNDIADHLFHISKPTSFGLGRADVDSLPEFMISFAMLPKPGESQPRPAHDAGCGFGARADETCSFEGTVVMRRVDSVRVLIAIVGNSMSADISERRLFMFTSKAPLSPLLSRTIPVAHVEYDNGMVYIVSRSGSDPTMLFWLGKPGHSAPRRAAETFDQGLGLSMYSIQGFTADQIRRLEPAACADGKIDPITGEGVATVTGACYQVDGRVIRFPL